jgi:integrase
MVEPLSPLTEDDIIEGYLFVTHKKLRIVVTGQLAELLGRIAVRKAQSKIEHRHLLMNLHGDPLTAQVLRNHFKAAKEAAIAANPKLEKAIKEFWFYDLRAKAADDVGDERGAQAATDLLGHDSQRTTSRHYRRRGIIVEPTT